MVLDTVQVRWQVGAHRSFQQLTGSDKGQCPKAQAQRNHLTCC